MRHFSLEHAIAGGKVFTRDGRPVTNIRIIDDEAPRSAEESIRIESTHPTKAYRRGVIVTIQNITGSSEYPYYHDGGSHKYGLDTDADLFTTPEKSV